MQRAVLAITNLSVRPSVCPSHAGMWQYDSCYDHAVFIGW